MNDRTQGGALSREELLDRVVNVVVQTLDAGRAAIGPNTALFSSVERFDSFMLLQLVLQLETSFGLSIPDEDLDRDTFSSPQAIADYLYRRLGSVPQG